MFDTTNDLQFYPTPATLAKRAFAKFQRPVRRLLEPSAGRGDLLAATGISAESRRHHWAQREVPADRIDCIELDLTNHPLLKAQGYRVVGHDFLQYDGATIYSHILLNPPFAAGAEHVLHAWNLLYDGELVAILNAETLRNPHTKKRQLLAQLVAQYSASAPEYLQEAFLSPDTQRQTAVEVVLIHLEKKGNFQVDFIDGLAKDFRAETTATEFRSATELMLPANWIGNQVTAFRLATKALREAAIADVRAAYYAGMLGKSLLDSSNADNIKDPHDTAAEKINAGYAKLKQSAWTSVLRSADVTRRLSSGAQRRLEAEFQTICELEFTVENVYAFLGGLIAKQGDIQLEMVCDVFDAFTNFHDENRVYYQGWKSNSKHRTCGMALRASRIVLPANRRDAYSQFRSNGLCWDDAQRFRDFDKVFRLLDGKPTEGDDGIEAMFNQQWDALCNGERATSAYFDARFYPKSGTFHLFPTRKDLVERLNRLVGQQRTWLPPDDCMTPPGFWDQYEQAEKINRAADLRGVNAWALNRRDDDDSRRAGEKLAAALQTATAKVGIEYDPDSLLTEMPKAMRLPLKKAA